MSPSAQCRRRTLWVEPFFRAFGVNHVIVVRVGMNSGLKKRSGPGRVCVCGFCNLIVLDVAMVIISVTFDCGK